MQKKYKSNLLRTAAVISFVALVNLASSSSGRGDGVCNCPPFAPPVIMGGIYCMADQFDCVTSCAAINQASFSPCATGTVCSGSECVPIGAGKTGVGLASRGTSTRLRQ